MYYYLSFVKRINDGSEARELLRFDDSISATATMHQRMGNAMADANCSYAFAVVHNYLGQQMKQDNFVRPTETAEAEE